MLTERYKTLLMGAFLPVSLDLLVGRKVKLTFSSCYAKESAGNYCTLCNRKASSIWSCEILGVTFRHDGVVLHVAEEPDLHPFQVVSKDGGWTTESHCMARHERSQRVHAAKVELQDLSVPRRRFIIKDVSGGRRERFRGYFEDRPDKWIEAVSQELLVGTLVTVTAGSLTFDLTYE